MTDVDLLGDSPKRKLSNGYGGRPGEGPQGETCGSCAHCRATGTNRRTYYKCGLVRATGGPGTDIRVRTPACQHWKAEAA